MKSLCTYRHEADRHEADRHEADRHEADRHKAVFIGGNLVEISVSVKRSVSVSVSMAVADLHGVFRNVIIDEKTTW
jgi:hypothetical protein